MFVLGKHGGAQRTRVTIPVNTPATLRKTLPGKLLIIRLQLILTVTTEKKVQTEKKNTQRN